MGTSNPKIEKQKDFLAKHQVVTSNFAFKFAIFLFIAIFVYYIADYFLIKFFNFRILENLGILFFLFNFSYFFYVIFLRKKPEKTFRRTEKGYVKIVDKKKILERKIQKEQEEQENENTKNFLKSNLENVSFSDLISMKMKILSDKKFQKIEFANEKLQAIEEKILEFRNSQKLEPEEKMLDFLQNFEFNENLEAKKISSRIFPSEINLKNEQNLSFRNIFTGLFLFLGIPICVMLFEFWLGLPVYFVLLYFLFNTKLKKLLIYFNYYEYAHTRWLVLQENMEKYFSSQIDFSKIVIDNSVIFKFLIDKITQNFEYRKNYLEKIEKIVFSFSFSNRYDTKTLKQRVLTEKKGILKDAIWSKKIISDWIDLETQKHKNLIENLSSNPVFVVQQKRLEKLVLDMEKLK